MSDDIYAKISSLFYATDVRNQTIAFELAKSQNCYDRWINDQYAAWMELPFFVAHAAATRRAVDADVLSDPVAVRHQQLARFAKAYFRPEMSFQGWEDRVMTVFPAVLLQCVFLEVLDLAWNQLETLPQDIDRLDQLRVLNLIGNETLRHLPSSLAQLEQLEELIFSGQLTLFEQTVATPMGEQQVHQLPLFFRQMYRLRRLYIDGVLLDALPEWLPEMRQLQELELASNLEWLPYLILPDSLVQLSQLTTLGINGYLTHIPQDIDQLQQLECLRIASALAVPDSLVQLPQLKSLNLSHLSLSYPLATASQDPLGTFRGTQTLPEGQSRIQLYGWDWMKQLQQLEEFIFIHDDP